MPSPRLNVCIAFLSVLAAIIYGMVHLLSVIVSELTKDTFETFSLDARVMPIDLQHRIMFSLIGFLLAQSGGYFAHDYLRAKGVSGKLLTTFGDLRLWITFLAAVTISCSVFYHAVVIR